MTVFYLDGSRLRRNYGFCEVPKAGSSTVKAKVVCFAFSEEFGEFK